MINKETINHARILYENIFGDFADMSIEFTNFACGRPHLLRMKIDEELIIINSEIMNCVDPEYYKELSDKRDKLKELERLIMEYIENNEV
jgi:hypothetical protein